MDVAQRQQASPSHPGAAGPFRYLEEVVAQARFRTVAPAHLTTLYKAPVPCTAVVIACFRGDGSLLMLRAAGSDSAWDLPHGVLPKGQEPAPYATQLLAELGGVRAAAPLRLFGMIDWGPAAIAAGWGWTACLIGDVGAIQALPGHPWVSGRAFVPLPEALRRAVPDLWYTLKRKTLEEASAVFDADRDFWLLQTLAALSLADRDDVLG
ncbi:MAG TPA: hypothetical protein VKY74_05975 [Chloroflexia bacterium]|nr:hypothetical protein [Chloroflexia bacterium]